MFFIWLHGIEELQKFRLRHLNNMHTNIKIILNRNKWLTAIPECICSQKIKWLTQHTVYGKPTYMNLCLHAKLHHHPVQKQAVLTTLM